MTGTENDSAAMVRDEVLEVTFVGRSYPVRVRLPAEVDHPMLVLNLHGSHGNAALQAESSGLERLAGQCGFVVAHPEGAIPAEVPNPERLWLWNVPGVPTTIGSRPGPEARDDIGFLTAVIDTAGDRYGTGDRACLAGMSGGARMASAYALARPDRTAALAAVAGLRAGTPDPAAGSDDHHRVPVLAVHGDADETNPYDHRLDLRWNYSLPEALAAWADRNGCRPDPDEAAVADRITKISFAGPAPCQSVVGFRLAGGGHSWPGGADPDAFTGFDATAEIGRFFRRHTANLVADGEGSPIPSAAAR